MGRAIDRLEMAIASGSDPDLLGLARVFIPKHYRIQNGKRVEVDGYWKQIDTSRNIEEQLTPVERANYTGRYGFGKGERRFKPEGYAKTQIEPRWENEKEYKAREKTGKKQRSMSTPTPSISGEKDRPGQKIGRYRYGRHDPEGANQNEAWKELIGEGMKSKLPGFRVGGGMGEALFMIRRDENQTIDIHIDRDSNSIEVERTVKGGAVSRFLDTKKARKTEHKTFDSVAELKQWLATLPKGKKLTGPQTRRQSYRLVGDRF